MRNKSRKESGTAHLRKAFTFEEDERSQFTVGEIVEAIRAAGAIWRADLPLKEAVCGALADRSPDMDALLVLSFQAFARVSGKRGRCAVVSTKELLQVSPHLANPDFFKGAVDATFKGFFGDWKLMPLRVFSKHLAPTTLGEGIRSKSWCTQCTPVLYCVTNSDGAASCEHLFWVFGHVPLAKLGCLSKAEASQTCPRRP